MSAVDILLEINRLPLGERLSLVEKALHSIRLDEQRERMRREALLVLDDYRNDPEMTAFTALDGEKVHESI